MALRFAAMGGWRRGRRLPCSMRPARATCGRWRAMLRGMAYVGLGGTAAGSAVVMKVAPDGKATKIFEGKELAVQAVRVAADGSVLAATSPDGKVYRVPAGRAGAGASLRRWCSIRRRRRRSRSIFGTWRWVRAVRCMWRRGLRRWCIGCLRVGARRRCLFKTADQHIRCLLLGAGWDAVGGDAMGRV